MPANVSIITVYYNTPEELMKLHYSMERVLPRDEYEWIIADNQSLNNLSADLPNSIYVRLPQNYGFGRANNIASEKATGKYLFFVNPDCEFVEDCLTPLRERLAHGSVGAVGPRVVNTDGTVQLSFGPYLSIAAEARQKMMMRLERTGLVQQWLQRKSAPAAVPYVSACALMTPAELFRRIGGFDETFFLYHEDVDLCKRLRKQGAEILYIPDTRIVHARNKSTEKERERVEIEYRKSQIHYYRKHHKGLQLMLLKTYLSAKFASKPDIRRLIWKDSS